LNSGWLMRNNYPSTMAFLTASTFGVMFAINQAAAAAELGRVPLGRSANSGDLGTTRRSGGIFRSHCPTQRRTTSALIAIGVG
jgi:hypothetical protein